MSSNVSQAIGEQLAVSEAKLKDLRAAQSVLLGKIATGKGEADAGTKADLKAIREEIAGEAAHNAELTQAQADAQEVERLQAISKAKADKITSCHDTLLALESTSALDVVCDQTAAAFLKALSDRQAARKNEVEPLFHAALQKVHAHKQDARLRYEDSAYIHIDRVRGTSWHDTFATAKFIEQVIKIAGPEIYGFVQTNYMTIGTQAIGTFEDAGQQALNTIQTILAPLLDGSTDEAEGDVIPAWKAAFGPEKGSKDPQYLADQANALIDTDHPWTEADQAALNPKLGLST